jgi:multidrug resistance efflux pump
MASSFSRTLRSLEDRGPSPLRLALTLLVLGAWGGWLCLAKVEVYATTTEARLEVKSRASRVSAQEGGRVASLAIALGRDVAEGEVLLQLDATVEQRRLDEELARAAGTVPKLIALNQQLAVANEVRATRWRLNGVSAARAKVALDEADAARARQEELGAMAKSLSDAQLLSRTDKVKADGDVVDSQLRLRGARVEVSRLGATQRFEDQQEAARIAELDRLRSDLEAERTAALAAVETARAGLARRTIRAAASGRLGGIAPLQIGDVLKPGDVIATIVPRSAIHVVAELPPARAVGRVVAGQRARVRLEGFAWTEYGMLDATVVDVANEPANGTVRAELVLVGEPPANVPVQHGIPASVDVCVEHVSPLVLLLRELGAVAAPPAAAPLPVARPAPVAIGGVR